MLNRRGGELEQQSAPVTLPKFQFADTDIEKEAREAAARVAERKIVRAGLDAWREIGKAESFENWKRIGAALLVGKHHALKVTGANAAWGQHYSRVFCDWMREHHFDQMKKSVRLVAIELAEHASEITAWRDTLPERQRRRLIHPLSVTRRWRQATQAPTKCTNRTQRAARAAWKRFTACMNALPPSEARPLWETAQVEAVSHL
jgi:hypothetical protein